jgi:hypothetical protein
MKMANHFMTQTNDACDLERLLKAAHRAADKMKREYDRRQPDAPADECWAECGGVIGTRSCYSDANERMTEPILLRPGFSAFRGGYEEGTVTD